MDALEKMIMFVKIQNEVILQLLIQDEKLYEKINKEIVKAWEGNKTKKVKVKKNEMVCN